MIKSKQGKCEDCEFIGYLYSAGRCKQCYWKHRAKISAEKKQNGGITPNKNRTPIKPKFKQATGERALFKIVYTKQQGKCYITGEYYRLEDTTASQYMHVLAKGKYKEFKLFDKNILFVNERVHYLFDFGTKEQLYKEFGKYKENLDELYRLKDELIEEYKKIKIN